MKIYLASSWRNKQQPAVVEVLRSDGHGVYDFRNPPGNSGFGWEQLDCAPLPWDGNQFCAALETRRAKEGFAVDMDHLRDCDACVLLLPCGRSAHLELGWAVGAGKRTAILLDHMPEPELMYRMVGFIGTHLDPLRDWLATQEVPCRAGRGWGRCRCRTCDADRRMDP